jgi:hypothetical protein
MVMKRANPVDLFDHSLPHRHAVRIMASTDYGAVAPSAPRSKKGFYHGVDQRPRISLHPRP